MPPVVLSTTLELSSFPAAPVLQVSYADTRDRDKHMHVMERLAEEVDRPLQEVKPLYEDILMHLRDSARIRDYLPILVSKRVKRLLQHDRAPIN